LRLRRQPFSCFSLAIADLNIVGFFEIDEAVNVVFLGESIRELLFVLV
jgi:hypothetical protein